MKPTFSGVSIRRVILVITCLPALLAGLVMIGLWYDFSDRSTGEYNSLLSQNVSRVIAQDAEFLSADVSDMVKHLSAQFSRNYTPEALVPLGEDPGRSQVVEALYLVAVANNSFRIFVIYRITIGVIILICLAAGVAPRV